MHGCASKVEDRVRHLYSDLDGLELADWLGSWEDYDQISILLMSADGPQHVNGNKHLRTLRNPFEVETLLHIVAELPA